MPGNAMKAPAVPAPRLDEGVFFRLMVLHGSMFDPNAVIRTVCVERRLAGGAVRFLRFDGFRKPRKGESYLVAEEPVGEFLTVVRWEGRPTPLRPHEDRRPVMGKRYVLVRMARA